MAEHTPTPWFTNRKFEVGPRPRTDDQSDGMLHPVADVFGDNAKEDAAFIVKACNSHDALVKALDWAMARVVRKAPHHAIEGDGELYSFAEAHSLLAKLKPAAIEEAGR